MNPMATSCGASRITHDGSGWDAARRTLRYFIQW
jgi:hypothetical protein